MSDRPKYETQDLDLPSSVIVRPFGNLDIYTSPELRSELDRCTERGILHFILDLTGVEYIDSTGLGSLASFMDRMKKKSGTVRLSGLNGVVLKAFVFTNLLDLFLIYETLDEALTSLRGDLGSD